MSILSSLVCLGTREVWKLPDQGDCTTLYSMYMHMQADRDLVFLYLSGGGNKTEDRISICESECLCIVCELVVTCWISRIWRPDITELDNINWFCHSINWKLKPLNFFISCISFLFIEQDTSHPGTVNPKGQAAKQMISWICRPSNSSSQEYHNNPQELIDRQWNHYPQCYYYRWLYDAFAYWCPQSSSRGVRRCWWCSCQHPLDMHTYFGVHSASRLAFGSIYPVCNDTQSHDVCINKLGVVRFFDGHS